MQHTHSHTHFICQPVFTHSAHCAAPATTTSSSRTSAARKDKTQQRHHLVAGLLQLLSSCCTACCRLLQCCPTKYSLPSCACSFLTFLSIQCKPFFLCVEPVKSCHQSQVAFNLSISLSPHPKPNSRETQKFKIRNSCIQNCSQL